MKGWGRVKENSEGINVICCFCFCFVVFVFVFVSLFFQPPPKEKGFFFFSMDTIFCLIKKNK